MWYYRTISTRKEVIFMIILEIIFAAIALSVSYGIIVDQVKEYIKEELNSQNMPQGI